MVGRTEAVDVAAVHAVAINSITSINSTAISFLRWKLVRRC